MADKTDEARDLAGRADKPATPVKLEPNDSVRLAAAGEKRAGMAYWEFVAREDGGLTVRYVGAKLSIMVKPECSNVIQLHAGRH